VTAALPEIPGFPDARRRRAPARVRADARALARWLGEVDGDEAILHRTLIRELRPLVGADAAAALCPLYSPDLGWFSDYVHTLDLAVGRDDEVRAGLAAARADRFSPIFPLVPGACDRVLYASAETSRAFSDYDYRRLEIAIEAPDAIVGVVLSDGGDCVGWLGFGSYDDAFTPWAAEVIESLAPALRRRLALEQRVRHLRAMSAAFELVIAHLDVPALLLAGARPLHLNEAAQAWCDHDRASFRAAIDASLAGAPDAPFTVTERHVSGMPPLFLAVQRRAPEPRALEDLARVYGLTPRERAVLEQLARGLANKEIAATLRCTVKTIEAHVTSMLRKMRAESRAEILARLLRAR
jgi:DNA-binding CsgD family transcriptional regulator